MNNVDVQHVEDLDELTAPCDSPDCDYDHSMLVIRPDCHPKASVYVMYTHKTGKICIMCNKCNKAVMTLAVEYRTMKAFAV